MKGRVFWITGLSGAGKTTIGRALYNRLQKESPATVFLDGDELREAFGNDLGYTSEARLACAMRYAGLCRLLASQGLTVICCTISMFHAVRDFNRAELPGYFEVYVKVSNETLTARDQKGMYSAFAAGAQADMMGLDLAPELPRTPDIVIENENSQSFGDADSIEVAIAGVVEKIIRKQENKQ